VVALLALAGAKLNPEWYEDDEDRRRAATKMRSDPRMLAALRGKIPPSQKAKRKRRREGDFR
jgi:hypothetical protein